MPYNPRKLSDQQLSAGKQILNAFHSIVRWVVLLACMQSGKTDCFLFVAAEMLREGKVKKVVIICGNNEKELKIQLEKDMKKFMQKYERDLIDNEYSDVEIHDICTHIEENIELKSGAELNAKYDDHTIGGIKNTLFIWDESHYAASKKNRPNKFLERMGVTANGDPCCLEGDRNNFVLSVSATPYAEISDIYHEDQPKKIIRLIPGENYRGVKFYLQNKKIIGFKSFVHALSMCFRKYAVESPNPSYAVVRVNGNDNMEQAIKIARENGWAYKIFDSEQVAIARKTRDSTMILSLDELKDAPEQNTVIFIRQMCRMGKVVPKEHIAFVFETSLNSKTDTLLQGLLGRMCGYHSYNIDIYIHMKLLTNKTRQNTTELEKYVKLMENDDINSIPQRAANLIGSTSEPTHDAFPIPISGFCEDHEDPDYSESRNERITHYLKEMLNTGRNLHNMNGVNHPADILRQINSPETDIVVRCFEKKNNRTNGTYKEVPASIAGILSGEKEKNAVRSQKGCGLRTREGEKEKVVAWYFPTNKFRHLGFPMGTLVVQAVCKFAEEGETIAIPHTSGKEAFSTKHEDATEVIGNGTCALTLSPETATSVDVMKIAIEELIQLSLEPHDAVTMANCITSNQDASGAWQGILVNEVVYKALQKGGVIFTYIKNTHNKKIKTFGKSGPSTKACKESGMKRLCKIEW